VHTYYLNTNGKQHCPAEEVLIMAIAITLKEYLADRDVDYDII